MNVFKSKLLISTRIFLISFVAFSLLEILITPALACDTDIKKSDGYKELAEKLKCLNAKIEIVLKTSPEFKRQTIVLFAPPELLDFKTDKCIKTSSLPNQFRMVIREGLKFCNDDGWVWGISTSSNYYPLIIEHTNGVRNQFCPIKDKCIWTLHSSPPQKMQAYIAKAKYKNQDFYIGRFKRLEE